MPESPPLRDAADAFIAAGMTAAAAFRVRGWKWGAPGHRSRIPDAQELAAALTRLAANLTESPAGHTSSTGRLHVQRGDDGEVHMSMDLGTIDGFYGEADDA